jgi:D-galactosamine 6-phosphate deaminase/isomerase
MQQHCRRKTMPDLGRDEAELEPLGALWTAREIEQQPRMLRKTQERLEARSGALNDFLRPLLQNAALRIVLTGAGSSAFIGECLGPYLGAKLRRRVDAIPTTDLICAPHLYFSERVPTLLVSFARSGNSPESIAAVQLAERFLPETHHLVVTCNPDGALARNSTGATILLPEETHDRSFAMTSSFSCMMYAALAALSGIERMQVRAPRIAHAVEAVIARELETLRGLAAKKYERVVYLGSHLFKGLAREAALKLLELTDGQMIAAYDSPLGFRHGPKTIVNGRTLVVIYLSNDAYTRRYDVDLLEEIRRDAAAGDVLAISAREEGIAADVERIFIREMHDAEDVDLLFPFVAAAQIFAFEAAIDQGISPDNPNRTGTVHRVVQGVRIHAFG